jgi:hypothetical protein
VVSGGVDGSTVVIREVKRGVGSCRAMVGGCMLMFENFDLLLFFHDEVTFLVFSRGLLGRLGCEREPRTYSEAFAGKVWCLGRGVRGLFS